MAIEVGNVFEGRVTGVKPFGAFVALPEGRVGMVHISEVSNEFVQDIAAVLHDGDTVKVQVINVAPDGKIALSIKRLLPPSPRQPREGRGPRPGAPRDGGRSGANPETTCKKLAEQFAKADEALFTQMVRDNSDAANSESGGSVGFVDQDKLRPEFAAAMRNVKPGQIVGPVKTPEGYYFIRVAAIVPEERIPFEKASEEIRRKLDMKAKNEMRAKYADNLKSKALIRYYF